MAERPLYVYRLDVEYPPRAFEHDYAPPGWEPGEWDGDPSFDSSFHWPKVQRYLSASGAERRAELLRSFGAKVTVVPSLPVRWEEPS